MALDKQVLDFATLEALIVAELGTMSENFVPTYEWASTLLDKIGATVSLQSGIKDHLDMFDDITLPNGATVEEYIHDLLEVASFDPESLPYGQDVIDTKKAYHYRSGDKKIELPVWNSEMKRAFNSPEGLASFTARMLQRIEDTKKAYKFEAKKKALGVKLIRDAVFEIEDLPTNPGTYLKGINSKVVGSPNLYTALSKETIIASNGKRVGGDVVEAYKRNVQIALPADKATADAFITGIQQIVEDLQFTSRKGNPFGVAQQSQPSDLVLLIKKGTMPVLNVASLASAFNKELLGLGVQVKVVADFGLHNDQATIDLIETIDTEQELSTPANVAKFYGEKVYAILADKRIVKYMETLNETTVDINGNARRTLYTHHFGETIMTSDAVNYVVITDNEI